MSTSLIIKRILSAIFYSFGVVNARLNKLSTDGFLILGYHRILTDKEITSDIQAGMYVKPNTFENHLRFLKKYFKIAPLSDILSENIGNKGAHKPYCSLTFDDGWRDFFDYAFPVLTKNKIPATVFLPTNFIGSNRWFWTDRLSQMLMQKKMVSRENKQNKPAKNIHIAQIEKLNGPLETQIETSIEMLKALPHYELEEIMEELSDRWDISLETYGRAFLSWEEVRKMKRSGLISFGSHTANHPILTALNNNEIHAELMRSKEKLIAEEVENSSFIPFCYPNGNYNEQISKIVRNTGYAMSVTTKNGWNKYQTNSFNLNRILIHQDMTSNIALFGCRIVNIF